MLKMPLLALTNTTSHQSRSIISTIQASPLRTEYTIRGLTRDPSILKAQTLASETGIELAHASPADPISLRTAFQNADIVFATTITLYDGHVYEHEVHDGKAVADAAVAMAVPYIIYSILPSISEGSGGVLTRAGHFDGKGVVEEYIRSLLIREAFVSPEAFTEDFHGVWAPRSVPVPVPQRSSAGESRANSGEEYAVTCFVDPSTKIPLIDVQDDFGKWVVAMISDFERFEDRVVCAAARMYSFAEIVEIMSKVSGKRVVYRQVSKEVWGGLLSEKRRGCMLDMLQCVQDWGYFGERTEEKVRVGRGEVGAEVMEFEGFLKKYPLILS